MARLKPHIKLLGGADNYEKKLPLLAPEALDLQEI
jgi:hypothetical protein